MNSVQAQDSTHDGDIRPSGVSPSQAPGQHVDTEKQPEQTGAEPPGGQSLSVFKGLGWLDRLLALWIFLAMVLGILLGNFVPNTSEALEKGKFVDVSIPIGMCFRTRFSLLCCGKLQIR
jgi:ACR3 family arsenite transporter